MTRKQKKILYFYKNMKKKSLNEEETKKTKNFL